MQIWKYKLKDMVDTKDIKTLLYGQFYLTIILKSYGNVYWCSEMASDILNTVNQPLFMATLFRH